MKQPHKILMRLHVVLLLILCTVVPLFPFLVGQKSPFAGDVEYTHHTLIQYMSRPFSGWPLWSDHIFCGYPYVADSQAAPYYPMNWLLRWQDSHAGYIFFILVHLVIAALGARYWLRGHRISLAGQLVAAVGFAYCGFFFGEFLHLGLFAAMAWSPWWLGALYRMLRHARAQQCITAGILLALLLLSGGPQIVTCTALISVVYGLAIGISFRHQLLNWQWLSVRLASIVITLCIGLGLAAVSLLPVAEFVPLSQRAIGLTQQFASQIHLGFQSLWGIVINPNLPRPAIADEPGLARFEVYAGSICVYLAVIGIARGTRARRGALIPYIIALCILGILCLGATLGDNLPIFNWLLRYVPLFSYFRAPARLIFITNLCIVFLAAIGLDTWTRKHVSRRFIFVSAGIGMLTLVATNPAWVLSMLRFLSRPTVFGLLAILCFLAAILLLALLKSNRQLGSVVIVALAGIDMVCLSAPQHPTIARSPRPQSRTYMTDGSLQGLPWLAKHATERVQSRVLVAPGFGYGTYNYTFRWHLDGVSGFNGSSLLRFLDVIHLINEGTMYPRTGLYKDEIALKPTKFDNPLSALLAAPYLLINKPLASARYQLIKTFPNEYLYKDTLAMPRAYLSYRTVVGHTHTDRALLLKELNPREMTIVEDEAFKLKGPKKITAVPMSRSQPEQLVLRAKNTEPAILVISDTFYPGWHATVDGKKTAITPVNHVFRGILLQPGDHHIQLVFRPMTFVIGKWISLFTIPILALFALHWIISRKRAPCLLPR